VIAGSGDDRAARARRRREMRASHADRERVIDTLKAAYVYGLVTKDELDERVSQALASRTCAELALITDDIPAGLAAAPPTLSPPPAKASAPARARLRPGERAVVATAIVAGLAFLAAFFVPDSVAVLLGLGATGSALLCLFLAAVQILSARLGRRYGGELPPPGAVDTGRSAGQLPQARQPRRQSPADAARIRSLRPRLST
jgi:hypothetical protein